MRFFVAGFIAALLVLCAVFVVAVETGSMPARADGNLLPFERWASRTALRATVAREAPRAPYPFADTPEAETRGATLYVQNCAICHSTAHSTPNAIALGLGVHAPRFAKHGVDDDPPGETYWKVEHGIRFTGMPAFGKTFDQQSAWDVAYFLAHKPGDLAPSARAIWEDPKIAAPPTPLPEPSQSPALPARG